jgi:iron complex outermembrane receptor protein
MGVTRSRGPTALLSGTSILAFALTAHAQTEPQETKPQEELEAVVVTGSRVITNGNNSPTPVTVVDAEQLLQMQPTTISDALNRLPVFSGSNDQLANPNAGIGAGGGGNGVASKLNLRNLGSARTLVLLDGKRIPPTTSTGIVDSDMIPQLMVKRVDVVTGGVSAVYGSDAISGVVNFVTDRNFNGLKFNVQSGVSEEHDGRQYEAGLAAGMPLFGGRGHIEGSYEYRDDEGILYRSSRPDNHLWAVVGLGTAAAPYYLTGDTRRSDVTFGGRINNGVLSGQQFSSNGVLTPFVNGTLTGTSNLQVGGDGAYADGSLKSPLRSHQLFGRMDYDFTDALHGYLEFAGNKKRNEIYSTWQTLNNVTISAQNAFLPQAYRTQLAAANQSTFTFGKFIQTAPRLNPSIDETQLVFNTGLEGKLAGKYDWDVAYVRGSAKLDNTENANLNNLRLAAALDAVVDPGSGQTVCRATLTNPGLFPGCVPLNVFGPTAESADALAYILGNPDFTATTVQDDVSASISGAPFDIWAGPFKTALSAEWRRQTYHATSAMPPGDPAAPLNCTAMGLRYNCTPTTSQYFNSFANRSEVSQTVYEGALEFDAPLLASKPLVASLNLNGALRYTHYDTSGSYTTWKAGVDWHINDSVRFRGTRSRDIRAPTLDDLFAPSVGTPQSVQDLLFTPPITSNAVRFESGNPNVTAEIGKTTTFGVVLQPQALPGFSASVDAFDILIENAISALQGTNQTLQRVCYASGGTSPYCALQTRAFGNFDPVAGNVVTMWRTTSINIAEVHTWGGDLELNYATEIGSHPLAVRGMLTYQPHIKYATPGLPTLDQGGVAYGQGGLQASPSKRVTASVRYSPMQSLTLDVLTRWRSALALTGDPSVIVSGAKVPSVTYTNLNVGYRVPQSNLDVYLNVQNVFDEGAPPANYYGTQANVGLFGGYAIGDDPIGRYYSLGLRYQF